MEKEYIEEKKYLRAQKRVKDIRGFYAHFIWFVAINLFLMISNEILCIFHENMKSRRRGMS